MTPKENVDEIMNEVASLIRMSGRRISHIANDLDIAHQTIDRILGQANNPNKYGCSMPNVAVIAHHYGYELRLVPKSSAGAES